jgi:hypothetical protein
MFFFNGKGFHFILSGDAGSELADDLTLWNIASEVLDKYASQPPGSWKHGLFLMKKDVLGVLYMKARVELTYFTWVVEFTNSSPLWHERVLLGAPCRKPGIVLQK